MTSTEASANKVDAQVTNFLFIDLLLLLAAKAIILIVSPDVDRPNARI